MKADDFGRYTADPQILRASCYPRRDDLRNTDMTRRLVSIQTAGLVRCYEVTDTGASRWLDVKELASASAVGTKRFLVILKFNQQVRSKASKYPDPPEIDTHVRSTCLADDTHVRTKTETETETYSKTEAQALADARTGAVNWLTANHPSLLRRSKSFTKLILHFGNAQKAFDFARQYLEKEDPFAYALAVANGESRGGNSHATPQKSLKDRPRSTKYAS